MENNYWKKQEAVVSFAEVFQPSEIQTQHNTRPSTSDNRLMVYFQVYIPDHFQPDTLLAFLRVLKPL